MARASGNTNRRTQRGAKCLAFPAGVITGLSLDYCAVCFAMLFVGEQNEAGHLEGTCCMLDQTP